MNVAKVMILIVAVGAIAAGLTTLVLTHLTVVDRWIIPYNFTVAQEGIGIVTDQTIPLPWSDSSTWAIPDHFLWWGSSLRKVRRPLGWSLASDIGWLLVRQNGSLLRF